MTTFTAKGFPADAVRARARRGPAEVFPPDGEYGTALFGAGAHDAPAPLDLIDNARLVPPVFMPQRLEKLIELGREPLYGDVVLDTAIGGLRASMPVYVSAFGSTQIAAGDVGVAVSRQAGRLGIPLVIGENVVPMNGYGRLTSETEGSLLARIRAYTESVPDGLGGVVVQQSTEDADAEVWNLTYSDPSAQPLLDTGRLAFELKVGQGAKPGLGGMTVVDAESAGRIADQYAVDPIFGADAGVVLRSSSPGTFTEEILRQQIRLMRNNFPRVKVWVKLHPGRDVREAALVAWESGADAVTVDGAEAGSGWIPRGFADHVGLPLGECLCRIGRQPRCLLVSGRMWEGTRAVKCLALGATAVGLGRAALLAAQEDPENGLVRLVRCLELEMRLLISSLGRYAAHALDGDDVLLPDGRRPAEPAPTLSMATQDTT
ncbi:glutamate synthase-related protein [Amycolatopsis sp. CA-230715]|uniref:glutamate synthase-related protein n=1 Tax=Amycolatopsis sp. CA-230715 TaxID=2745196 RepID=UPI001C00E021|nr:glutamate synthase-related protein [Amycolatopsis sp. CA-230715]QWF84115.1 Isopentenyl-diphosphate delta-isomerase [Amycolatopsis sp. CA-230715]